MLYANTGGMECFECRHIRHKRLLCPLKAWRDEDAGPCTAPEASEGGIVSGPRQSEPEPESTHTLQSARITDTKNKHNGESMQESVSDEEDSYNEGDSECSPERAERRV